MSKIVNKLGVSQVFAGGDITGVEAQEEAARRAAGTQAAAGTEALRFGAEQVGPFRDIGVAAAERLPGAEFAGLNRDPRRVTENPLFQALAKQQEQRLVNQQAALGRGASGETGDLLTQNVLRLGSQFQQQDFANQLAENQLRFGQLFGQTRLGANVAAGQATSGQGIIQGIGNVQAAGQVAGANAEAQANQQLLQLASAGAGAVFSDVRLKENPEYVETVNGIDMFKWQWTEDAKELVGDQPEYGPIAQLLRETNPEMVTTDESGFLKVA